MVDQYPTSLPPMGQRHEPGHVVERVELGRIRSADQEGLGLGHVIGRGAAARHVDELRQIDRWRGEVRVVVVGLEAPLRRDLVRNERPCREGIA
jgi:hypothetical protein